MAYMITLLWVFFFLALLTLNFIELNCEILSQNFFFCIKTLLNKIKLTRIWKYLSYAYILMVAWMGLGLTVKNIVISGTLTKVSLVPQLLDHKTKKGVGRGSVPKPKHSASNSV